MFAEIKLLTRVMKNLFTAKSMGLFKQGGLDLATSLAAAGDDPEKLRVLVIMQRSQIDGARASVAAMEACISGVSDALNSIYNAMVFSSRDWSRSEVDAWLYGVVVGWEDAMDEIAKRHGWDKVDGAVKTMVARNAAIMVARGK